MVCSPSLRAAAWQSGVAAQRESRGVQPRWREVWRVSLQTLTYYYSYQPEANSSPSWRIAHVCFFPFSPVSGFVMT